MTGLNRIPDSAIQNLDQKILQVQSFHQQSEKKIKSLELAIKDLAEVKLKQVSEDGDKNLSKLKQEINQQFRLASDNLIKSEEKTKDILYRADKESATKIQEVKDQTEFKIGQQKLEL
jgi:hypothetical protein